jgi:tetratricopeptide (TPR) repeat protein
LPRAAPKSAPQTLRRRLGTSGGLAWVAAAFLAASFAVHGPALSGPFVSDDRYYLVDNLYVREPSPAHALAILDPTSDVTLMTANWAPVHLFAHALQWRLFDGRLAGYHVCNIVLHATASALLVSLLLASGVSAVAALLGGLFFLLHPANVEAVAWISQLKTLLAMVLMLVALLWREQRPGLSTLAFGLALLAKALAAIALPFAAVLAWARAGGGREGQLERRASAGVLAAWAAMFAVFAAVQFVAFRHANQSVDPLGEALATRVLTSASIGARYLAMAATGFGVAPFHEPPPVRSALDPWVIAAAVAGLALGARALFALRARREEAAWWILAAGSWLPVAQVFPFVSPMADRYLYFILPGLIGGTLLAGGDALARLSPPARATAARAALALSLAACLVFAVQSRGRAALWSSEARLVADTVRHYPEGPTAKFLRAREAARRGDVDAALAALRAATASGPRGFQEVAVEPAFAPLRGKPAFDALLSELARRQIAELQRSRRLTEVNLMHLAQAYAYLGDTEAARAAFERALALDGAYAGQIRAQIEQLRALAPRPQPADR